MDQIMSSKDWSHYYTVHKLVESIFRKPRFDWLIYLSLLYFVSIINVLFSGCHIDSRPRVMDGVLCMASKSIGRNQATIKHRSIAGGRKKMWQTRAAKKTKQGFKKSLKTKKIIKWDESHCTKKVGDASETLTDDSMNIHELDAVLMYLFRDRFERCDH